MASHARPAEPITAPFLQRPIHHVGFHVPNLRAAIDTWVTVYGAGPFYLLEHVAYDECTSSGTPVVWDHSAGFGQWGEVPVELQQTHDLRPAELARPFTADGRSAVNHVGVTADDPRPRARGSNLLASRSACTRASASSSSSGTTRPRRSATASRSSPRGRGSTPSGTRWQAARAAGMGATRSAPSRSAAPPCPTLDREHTLSAAAVAP